MNPNVSRSRKRDVAVDRGGSDDGGHPAVLRRDEHLDGAGHVRLVRGEGILHRPGHRGDGHLVEDAVRTGEESHLRCSRSGPVAHRVSMRRSRSVMLPSMKVTRG